MTNTLYNALQIKEGDKITFKENDTVYTKKVQTVFVQSFNGITIYNVNRIGSGTGFTGVDANQVINIKKK